MLRVNFHEELEKAQHGLLHEGALVRSQLQKVLDVVDERDPGLARQVIADDDRVDDAYIATQSRVLSLLALQAPVAGDLRLVSAILHANMHLERMGDLCVNIAKFVLDRQPYPAEAPIVSRLREMSRRVNEMLDVALVAFEQRSVGLAEHVAKQDDAVDELNRGMLHDLKDYVGNEDSFEWASSVVLVARYLERLGDHVVDIAEQAAFLSSGVFREFTDASHPERDRHRRGA